MKTTLIISFFLFPILSFSQIPAELIEKADSILKGISPQINVTKTFKYNCNKSAVIIGNTYWNDCKDYSSRQKRIKRKEIKKSSDTNYEIVFDLIRFDTISEFVKIRFDNNGNMLSLDGINDVENFLLLLNSSIDIKIAKKLAIENNFSVGCVPWTIYLNYENNSNELKKYCWIIQNTIDAGDNQGCNSRGELLYIDAITGEILMKKQWEKECI